MTSKTTLPLYLTATATSLFGNSAIAIVLPWLVLERTGDAAMAGLVAAMSAVPGAIAAFVGGHQIDKVDLHRIKVLADADAGVPLSRVRELIDAEPDAFRAASAQIDAELETRIAELESTRQSLGRLAAQGEPFLPPRVTRMHDEMRALGVSERTLQLERDAWLLIQVLYPDLVTTWIDTQQAMLDDPDYRDLYLRTDQAFDYPPTIRGSSRSPRPPSSG